MIANQHQYKVAKRTLISLRARMAATDADSSDEYDAPRSQMELRIAELTREVEIYESLKVGKTSLFAVSNLYDLPELLISARVARGMTQKDLATYMGMKMQQIQKYEADRFQSASLRRVAMIADALGLDVHQAGELAGGRVLGGLDLSKPAAFPLGEMYGRGWLEPYGGSFLGTQETAFRHLSDFFTQAYGRLPSSRRRYARSIGAPHEPAISAWEARVIIRADAGPSASNSMPTLVNENWLSTLVGLSRNRDGARAAKQYLNGIGISFIVEDALPGMRLDGAALRTSKGGLVLALTLRDPGLEAFWVTLMHLVAHLILHIGTNKYDAIFDEIGSPADSDLEDEADVFSRETLIPSRKWAGCKSQYNWTREAILEDARRLGVGPAVVVGHIRRQAGDVPFPNRLTTNVDVRKQLRE